MLRLNILCSLLERGKCLSISCKTFFSNIVFHIHTEWWVEPNYIAFSVFICAIVRKRRGVSVPVAHVVIVR